MFPASKTIPASEVQGRFAAFFSWKRLPCWMGRLSGWYFIAVREVEESVDIKHAFVTRHCRNALEEKDS